MGIAYNTSVVRDGLVLHLDAANVKSYPGTGTTWSNIGTVGGAHTLTTAPLTTFNSVECFDMTAGYASYTGTTISMGTNYTLMGWASFLPDASVATWRTLWRTQPLDHPLLIQDGTNLIGTWDGSFRSFGVTLDSLGSETAWRMYCVQREGPNIRLYVNGQFAATVAAVSGNGRTWADVGYRSSQPPGYVATTMLYNNVLLTAAEIKQNFEAMRGRYGL